MKVNYKNIILYLIAFIAFSACSAGKHATAQSYDDDEYYQQNDNQDDYSNSPSNVDINAFASALDPYGRWVVSPGYGRVWICNEPGFTPYYTKGHWMYTTYGWTWASDYSWGWAPFHYGRWAHDASYGWMWVPGYEWGPAWVGWRTGGDYYGWAPLAPGINISVGFSFGNYMPADRWCFVPRRYVGSPHFANYRVDRGRNITIINNTTIIKNTNIYHNTRYVVGPDRKEVERFSGQRINTVKINNDNKPGNYRVVNKNTVVMYRPEIKKDVRINNKTTNNTINQTNNTVNINRGKDADKQRKEVEMNRNTNTAVPDTRKYDNTRDDKRKDVTPPKDYHNLNNDGNRNDNKVNDKGREDVKKDNPGDYRRDINDSPNKYPTTRSNEPSIKKDKNRTDPQDWNNKVTGKNNIPQAQPGTGKSRPPVSNNDRYRVQNHKQPQYRQAAPSPPQQQQIVKRKKDN